MKAIRNLLFFVFGGAIVFFVFGWYSGLFTKAAVEIKQIDSFIVAYENHLGEYNETTMIQEQIADQLWETGIDNYFSFSIFFDDPETTNPDEMRSMIGRVIAKVHEDKIISHTDDFLVHQFSFNKAAVVELPLNNIFSLYASIYKAYPLLQQYAAEHNIADKPFIEIYNIPGKIQVILPLEGDFQPASQRLQQSF